MNALAAALGRIPSGLFVLTARHGKHETGMLASWVQQAGFKPPMLTTAVQRDRFICDWIRASGRFTLNQIATGSKLAAYAGLAPVTRQSGKSLAAETRSRRGNHRLKNALFLAAFASLRSPDSKAFYDRKRAEGKRHNAALICLARRRCDVILAMLRTHQPYRPLRHPAELPKAA